VTSAAGATTAQTDTNCKADFLQIPGGMNVSKKTTLILNLLKYD